MGEEKTDRINFRLGPDLREALQSYVTRYDRSEADAIREAHPSRAGAP